MCACACASVCLCACGWSSSIKISLSRRPFILYQECGFSRQIFKSSFASRRGPWAVSARWEFSVCTWAPLRLFVKPNLRDVNREKMALLYLDGLMSCRFYWGRERERFCSRLFVEWMGKGWAKNFAMERINESKFFFGWGFADWPAAIPPLDPSGVWGCHVGFLSRHILELVMFSYSLILLHVFPINGKKTNMCTIFVRRLI